MTFFEDISHRQNGLSQQKQDVMKKLHHSKHALNIGAKSYKRLELHLKRKVTSQFTH